MKDETISPLRRRMIEDMTVRGFGAKTRHDYIRHVRTFSAFIGRSPDTATAEEVRRFQLHLSENRVRPPTINATVTALRFFFNVTVDQGTVGTTRGEPAIGRKASRRDHEAVIGFSGKAPRRRTHSADGIGAMELFGAPPPRIIMSGLAATTDRTLDDQSRSGHLPQHDAGGDLANGDQAPQCNEQLAGERHDHRRLARALRARGPRAIPLHELALLLEPQEAPGELD